MRRFQGLCLRSGASLPMLPFAPQPRPGAVWERQGARADLSVKHRCGEHEAGPDRQAELTGSSGLRRPWAHAPWIPSSTPSLLPHSRADEGGYQSCALQYF